MNLDISKIAGIPAELTPEQVEAALREANRPKGTACGTIQSKRADLAKDTREA